MTGKIHISWVNRWLHLVSGDFVLPEANALGVFRQVGPGTDPPSPEVDEGGRFGGAEAGGLAAEDQAPRLDKCV